MSGKIGKQIPNLPAMPSTSGPRSAAGSSSSASRPVRPVRPEEGPLMLVPAGFVANILGGLSSTVGEITGGFFGNPELGKKIGATASPFIKLLPFQVIEPSVAPQSAGPNGEAQPATGEPLVVVPAGFLGGILGGIGGNLLGGVVGKFLGNEDAGKTAGSIIGKFAGGVLPFGVVPPSVLPQSTDPIGAATQEPMVVVPAGFFGNLLSGLSGTVGGLIGGDTGRKIGDAASPLLKLVPFQDVPADLAPQSAGPDTPAEDRLIVVPAGFLGNLLSGLAGTIGAAVGGAFGDAKTGRAVGDAAAPVLDMIPFHAAPPDLLPQSTDPTAGTQEQMMLVPAGLFGSLLSGLAGTLGGVAGKAFGQPEAGRVIGEALGPIAKLIPFQAIDLQPVHAS